MSAFESTLREHAAVVLPIGRPGCLSATEVLASAGWFARYRNDQPQTIT